MILTHAQQRFLTHLSDGEWHTFNGRMQKMAWRLEEAGFIEVTYAFAMPGMPTRMNVRLKRREINSQITPT